MRTLYLSNKACIGIFIYYSILFIISILLVISYFYNGLINDNDVYIYAPLSGLFGTCIYYIRKLLENPVLIAPFCQSKLTLFSKIRLTPYAKIKMSPAGM